MLFPVNVECSCLVLCAFVSFLHARHTVHQDAVNQKQTNSYKQSVPEQRFVRGLGHGASLLSCERGFKENFLRTCFVSPEESQRSTSPLARASLMPATHTPGDDSQVSGDSETFVPAYFVLPEQRLARGLGHRASQQHPPHGRRLTALASLSRSRKSGEPLQPKTLKKPMFFFSHRQAEILGCRGARNPVKGYVGYKELCWPYVEPSWRLCWPYVGNMLAI